MSSLEIYFRECAGRVEGWLNTKLSSYNKYTDGLIESMRYSLFAGGKRIRPALMYASFEIFSDDVSIVTPYASAIEVLHTYSLIHDDLPSIDNDDLRRGKLTNHKVYGEAISILAGDALLTKTFELMADSSNSPKLSDKIRLESLFLLAKASGDIGMVGGQYADVVSDSSDVDIERLTFIHNHKTGVLIEYCICLPTILTDNYTTDFEILSSVGKNYGLAFQIIDDIIDVISTTEQMGKSAKSDIENNKATYVSLYGVEKSRNEAKELIEKSADLLNCYGTKSSNLLSIGQFILSRGK